jgi:hypothetical protein
MKVSRSSSRSRRTGGYYSENKSCSVYDKDTSPRSNQGHKINSFVSSFSIVAAILRQRIGRGGSGRYCSDWNPRPYSCKTTYGYRSRGVSYGASQTDSYRQACHGALPL